MAFTSAFNGAALTDLNGFDGWVVDEGDGFMLLDGSGGVYSAQPAIATPRCSHVGGEPYASITATIQPGQYLILMVETFAPGTSPAVRFGGWGATFSRVGGTDYVEVGNAPPSAGGGTNSSTPSPVPIPFGESATYGVSYERSTGTVRAFIDGVEAHSFVVPFPDAADGPDQSWSGFFIGGEPDDPGQPTTVTSFTGGDGGPVDPGPTDPSGWILC